MIDTLVYTPPPTIREFIKHYLPGQLFYDFIIGPVGSGKTTGIFFKLAYMAGLQAPAPDGIRRSRAVIVRNTTPQLRDTTIASWLMWFKDGQAGEWRTTASTFILRFGDVECEVLFRPLDTPQDVARVLSLEVTFVVLDEFVEIPRAIVDALSARCGRYPSKKDGGATNFGMWASSNPSNEDNWWFDYLHQEVPKSGNARYYLQPSGFSPDAENIDNLPGGRDYYVNQAKGKSEAYVNQFLKAQWGFSVAGQPVVPTFKADLHLSKKPLQFNPLKDLVVGLDPGIGGMAFTFGQEDFHGRLLVLGELTLKGVGVSRAITEYFRPYVKRRFPDVQRIVFAPDPAAANRAQTDEKTVVDIIREEFDVSIETNNRLPLRLDAVEHYTTRLTDLGPALLIDEAECPKLVRALKGGWRYTLNPKNEQIKGSEPDKNEYSHNGDSFGYLCRYHVHQGERLAKRDKIAKMRAKAPRRGGGYHYR